MAPNMIRETDHTTLSPPKTGSDLSKLRSWLGTDIQLESPSLTPIWRRNSGTHCFSGQSAQHGLVRTKRRQTELRNTAKRTFWLSFALTLRRECDLNHTVV